MSVSSLPEWKQLLLEKKRREEEERERREKEEEEKLASMPAWKRGIIQRRKAKQDNFGDREKDICPLQADVRSPSDCLSDTDSSITVNLGSDLSLSPDPGQWLDAEPKLVSQVSVETIVPVHENPFIRTQSAWRKSRDSDAGNDLEVKERDKHSPRGQDVDSSRGRDIELKKFRDINEKEKSRDRSQGRERENNREACDKDKNQWRESVKDAVQSEEKETHSPSGPFSPLISCLRTIRADNIIIIEQDRKGSDERRGRWREVERPQEDQQGKRGMKMDLREILAGGGSVTEIRASEVLIIKPSVSPEDRSAEGNGKEDGEMKTCVDLRRESMGRELRTDMSWLREKEKERPWGQATVINKDERKNSLDDSVFVERGGRVSQLLSKFGEHPKPPCRSKSSDNFLHPGRRKFSGDQDDQQAEEGMADGKNLLVKSIPKRSFSFSDRVISAEENGLGNEGCYERKHSNRNVPVWVNMANMGKETTSKLKLGCARLLDKERFGKHRDIKNEDEKGGAMQWRNQAEMWKKNRFEFKKAEPVDKRAEEKVGDTDGDKGFTMASVKTIEGISFARRIPIRQDGRTRGEREAKRTTREKSLENTNKEPEVGGQTEEQGSDKANLQREDGSENTIQPEASEITAAPAEALSLSQAAEVQSSYDSAFTECSSLLCTVPDTAAHRGPEWSGTGPQGPYLTHSVLTPQTEDLISKIEKVGDTTVYMNERGAKAHWAAHEMTKENKLEMQPGSNSGSESPIHNTTPRSPKRIAPIGIPPGPLEIQIPRTVFYVAEEMLEKKTTEGGSSDGQDWEGGRGVERRDSWRIGKPLSRIESLREKIRQRELEKLRQREAQGGDGSEAAEISDAQTADAKREEKGNEKEKEWEATAHLQKRPAEAERAQEEAAQQTSVTAFDVTQEVDMLKTCPQLPVSVPRSKADRAEEVTSECTTAATEVIYDSTQISEDEDGPLKHVEEKLRRPRGHHRNKEEEEDEEEKELSEEDVEEYSSSFDSVQSLSPSPPHPNSLAAMSRIYNLNTVGSRSGLCLRERAGDISSPVHLVKVKPLISNSQQGDSKAQSGDDSCGVQKVQQQIEQFQLKEQEVQKTCTSPNALLKDKEIKRQQSPKGVLKHQRKDNEEKPELNPKVSPQHVCSPTSQLKQTITITSSFLRSQSPDNSLKTTNYAPTPASSPSSPSPSHSPSISPSPTPSPTLFSIRSASGGQVKRGATITITPKKPAAGGATGSTVRPVTIGSTKTPSEPTTPTMTEPVKKKYPTVEEIEVIGGYQNLEKSCLVKNKGTPKKQANVCFDEDQLEQVCEYPSETCLLTLSLLPNDLGKTERPQGEDAQEDEGEVEAGAFIFKSTRNMGIATGPRLRVDESCPR
ncbi:uncharacterized protein ppp1r18 isoform X2 [Melanotaenia boesemani]|uniref:uncharacterized protein ppp1r18 isoform X2 n=1 Tax=Melanotaenia boesemani TaxID=1250792 RepID=UPI001C04B456|nr:uncharacterized protein ppp1r18 isoform X2 [Melanotaenia boesemani]